MKSGDILKASPRARVIANHQQRLVSMLSGLDGTPEDQDSRPGHIVVDTISQEGGTIVRRTASAVPGHGEMQVGRKNTRGEDLSFDSLSYLRNSASEVRTLTYSRRSVEGLPGQKESDTIREATEAFAELNREQDGGQLDLDPRHGYVRGNLEDQVDGIKVSEQFLLTPTESHGVGAFQSSEGSVGGFELDAERLQVGELVADVASDGLLR